MTDLDALEKLAREATPGPWEAYTECPGECCWLIRQPDQERQEWETMDGAHGVTWPECSQENARYIAAASPDVVLRLVAVARAAERYARANQQHAKAQMTAETAVDNYSHAGPELDRLADAMVEASRAASALGSALAALKEPTNG